MLPINLVLVVIAAAAAFIIGFLLHGPVGGKLWMKLANIHPTGKEKFSDMYGQMAWNFVVNLITAYALSVVYVFASSSPYFIGTSSICIGIICALIVWAGFIGTSSSIDVIWMGRSFKLWLYEFFCSLISILAMGIIISW